MTPAAGELQIRLRQAAEQDATFAYELFERTMRPYAEATWGLWLEARAREELRLACTDGLTRIVESQGVPIGIVRVVAVPGSHVQLEKLNVAPEFQGRGVGSHVLRLVLAEAAPTELPVRLRVLRVNPAKRLYERHGFKVTLEEDVRFHMEHALSDFTISPATEEEVRSGDIGRRLRHFNYRFVGEYPQEKPIRLNARAPGGKVVGGLRAFIFLHWLRIEVLWVDEEVRGKGVGTRLLREAERIACESGARNAALETFEWQAPGFYSKHGYAEAGRIEKYVEDYALILMRKHLEPP